MRRLALMLLAISPSALAHNIVDVGVALQAPAFAAASSNVTYTIRVTDYAYDQASGVVVTNTLPANAQLISAAGQGWSCSRSNGAATCSAESLLPGTSSIVIEATMPSSGIVHAAVSVQSLGTIDPNSRNDSAAADTRIYDPASCTASPAQLLAPADATELASGVANLTWTAVPNASGYRVWSAVEGASPEVIAEPTTTHLLRDWEIGLTEWWVETTFDGCPSIASEHRRFRSNGRAALLSVTNFGDLPASSIGTDLAGDIYVVDSVSSTLTRIAADGTILTVGGAPGQAGYVDGSIRYSRLNHPRALAVTPGGYVYVADTDNDVVRLFFPNGNGAVFGPLLTTVAGSPAQPGTADGAGNNARFNLPSGIAIAADGSVVLLDSGSKLVRRMTQPAGVVTTIGAGFDAPVGVAVNGNGDVFVSDGSAIKKISGGSVSVFANGFTHPVGLAFDALGNLFVADNGDNTIRKVAPSGFVTTIVVPGSLTNPTGVAFDARGRLWIADGTAIRVAGPVAFRQRAVHMW